MTNKQAVSWTIDENILQKIEKEAKEKQRSSSFIVNEHLIGIYKEKK